MESYSIPPTSFANFIWIKDGALFDNITLIEIDMTNGGAFRLELFDRNDRLLAKSRRPNLNGGWATFTLLAMEPPVYSGPYKLKLVNEAPGTRQVHGGSVQWP